MFGLHSEITASCSIFTEFCTPSKTASRSRQALATDSAVRFAGVSSTCTTILRRHIGSGTEAEPGTGANRLGFWPLVAGFFDGVFLVFMSQLWLVGGLHSWSVRPALCRRLAQLTR